MKKLILCCVLIVGFASIASAQESVDVLIKNALSEAVQSDKHVLIKFEASWCGWCHRMTKNIKNDLVVDFFNKNYVTLPIVVFENGDKIKLENPGSRDLIAKYKGDKAGLPFWVILNQEGKVVTDSFNEKGENIGCPASKPEVNSFVAKLAATSEITEIDKKNIFKIFQKD